MKHLLLCPAHMWGHTRPLCILAARMIKLRPITITFIVAVKFFKSVQQEISRELALSEEEISRRLRFLPIEQGEDPFDPAVYEQHLLPIWNKLATGNPIPCVSLDGAPCTLRTEDMPPTAVVIDVILMESFNTLLEHRKVLTTPFRVYTWLPIAINTVLSLCRFDGVPVVEAAASQMGVSFNDAARHLILVPTGRVVTHPGLPDMYDYEYHPQAFPMPADQCGRIYARIGRVLLQTDGVLTLDAADYYPEVASEFREWFAETSRKVYYAGPLVPSSGILIPAAAERDPAVCGAARFLDEQLAAKGERCVIYISFGTLFWPSDPEKVHAVLEVLIQRQIPFILTHPSALTVLSNDTMIMLTACNTAYVTHWVPQQTVLEHPATGWCLTHGGHNTVLECILAGVPMILWPIFTDQPVNAIHLSDHLAVAYELLEVRHGTGLGPIFRTGKILTGTIAAVREELHAVLERAFGADGELKRQKMKAVRDRLFLAWAEKEGEGGDDIGIARREMGGFVDDL
ncbi:UDP-Glycosyltransferase/glycogen phosphorylase [Lenzites betulinus]|nr:UDP-Glycosyltransferase/glycogen phosphorylase [Lenzites betulinus]